MTRHPPDPSRYHEAKHMDMTSTLRLLALCLPITLTGAALPGSALAGDELSIQRDQLQRQARFNLIKAVQQKLTEGGYQPGPVDGLEGPRTRAAIQAFQRDNNLSPDGELGHDTLHSLGLLDGE